MLENRGQKLRFWGWWWDWVYKKCIFSKLYSSPECTQKSLDWFHHTQGSGGDHCLVFNIREREAGQVSQSKGQCLLIPAPPPSRLDRNPSMITQSPFAPMLDKSRPKTPFLRGEGGTVYQKASIFIMRKGSGGEYRLVFSIRERDCGAVCQEWTTPVIPPRLPLA